MIMKEIINEERVLRELIFFNLNSRLSRCLRHHSISALLPALFSPLKSILRVKVHQWASCQPSELEQSLTIVRL